MNVQELANIIRKGTPDEIAEAIFTCLSGRVEPTDEPEVPDMLPTASDKEE
jgi:hypothetical protein